MMQHKLYKQYYPIDGYMTSARWLRGICQMDTWPLVVLWPLPYHYIASDG